MENFLDFENDIAHVSSKIKSLEDNKSSEVNMNAEIASLTRKYNQLLEKIYANLTPWQKVLVARHPDRPKALDYINLLINNFTPLSGDRLFAEDKAIVGGLGIFKEQPVMVIGIEKGHDLDTRLEHNFGMAKPEGYRKASRLMRLADKFSLPIIVFVDTAGAYPGQEAEERGQGEAIAKSIQTCLNISTPLINIIISEGGSGGAIAVATGDYVIMLEHAVYSVISPEGCASILWHDDKMAEKAATRLALTAQDLLKFNIIDKIVKEPIGGAHRKKEEIIRIVGKEIQIGLKLLLNTNPHARKIKKHNRFLNIGSIKKKK